MLALAVSVPLWFPALARRVIPDRYLVAYAPEPLQDFIFDTDPLRTLPTPVPALSVSANDLLGNLVPTDAVTTSTPLVDSGAEYVTGTLAPLAPTVTGTAYGFAPVGTEPPAIGTLSPAKTEHLLTGFTHMYQGWNNCGPATLAMLLSYWEVEVTQNDVASFAKPHPEDSNVRPAELQAYVESLGYSATVRIDGDLDLLKRLIAAGYPVIVEKGFDPEPDKLGWMGHYLLLIGYSEQDRSFTTMDSYLGPNVPYTYDKLDKFWRHFNRTYLVVYPPDQAIDVAAIIGADVDDHTMYTNALNRIRSELGQNPHDAFGWFNLGSVLVELGDYAGAAGAYDQARNIGLPFRMLWYQFGMYEAYYQMGRYEDVLTLALIITDVNNYPESEEAYYYMGLVYVARGQIGAARSAFNKALHYNPTFAAAQAELEKLNNQ